jgi:hypothetical protein
MCRLMWSRARSWGLSGGMVRGRDKWDCSLDSQKNCELTG